MKSSDFNIKHIEQYQRVYQTLDDAVGLSCPDWIDLIGALDYISPDDLVDIRLIHDIIRKRAIEYCKTYASLYAIPNEDGKQSWYNNILFHGMSVYRPHLSMINTLNGVRLRTGQLTVCCSFVDSYDDSVVVSISFPAENIIGEDWIDRLRQYCKDMYDEARRERQAKELQQKKDAEAEERMEYERLRKKFESS